MQHHDILYTYNYIFAYYPEKILDNLLIFVYICIMILNKSDNFPLSDDKLRSLIYMVTTFIKTGKPPLVIPYIKVLFKDYDIGYVFDYKNGICELSVWFETIINDPDESLYKDNDYEFDNENDSSFIGIIKPQQIHTFSHKLDITIDFHQERINDIKKILN